MAREKVEEELAEISSRNEFQEVLSQYNPQYLLEEYKELGEEVRYRDRIMHNSYYLFAIAVVFLFGNLVNWVGNNDVAINNPVFVVLFGGTGGGLLIFLSVVMDTYNEKRVRAEHRRRDVEKALHMYIRDSEEEEEVSEEVSPFAIQKDVIKGELEWYPGREGTNKTSRLINRISNRKISNYSNLLFNIGCLLLAASLVAVGWIVIN